MGAAMYGDREHLLPDRRRRERRRRARGPARVRPRRHPADRPGPDARPRPLPVRAARSSPAAALLRRRGREPAAPPLEYRVRRAAKKALAGARFLQLQICYRTELLERFMRAAHDTGLTERLALIPSICILRSVGGMRFVAHQRARHRRPARDGAPRRAGGRRRARVLRDRLRAGLPRAGPARRGRPSLHLVPQGRGHREALRAVSESHPRIERESNGYSASVALGVA